MPFLPPALLGLLLAAAPQPSAYTRAVAARASTPPQTRPQFTHLLDLFRAVYHDNPADPHAPDAVLAVADLLAAQGRTLHDPRSLHAALGQYEFLRTQYPASPLRPKALLAQATIESDDLHDPTAARAAYTQLLRESPHSEAAAEARTALAASNPVPRKPAQGLALTEENARTIESEPTPPPPTQTHSTPLAQVTAIRHWSTPTYTRVAIDLGDEVTFQAARVPHPDRIYFDLHGAHLSPELIGKSFDITDDGFLKKIRAAQSSPDVTRVVLDVADVTEYSAFLLPNPYRLIIDIHGAKTPTTTTQPAPDIAELPVPPAAARQASAAATHSGLPATAPTDGGDSVRPIPPQTQVATTAPPPRTAVPNHPTPTRPVPNTITIKAPATTTEVAAVSDNPNKIEATPTPTSRPIAATIIKSHRPSETAVPTKAADKTADGETSLIRALGLKIGRIVIDAGHGGHDSGTLGVDGIEEKDVVLDVALRLGKLLHERLGAEIIYTRSDDTFIPLETRTAIANKAQADLFLSIHANSSQDPTARGVETYYLNFTSDPNALDVAARENAVSGSSVHQLSDLVKKITLKDKIAESREFAADVESSLFTGLTRGNEGLKNRGVKKAPFVVLIGANMPSILAEISFVTNPRDATQLREPDYRQRVAESLYNGVAKYESGLAGPHALPIPTTRATTK